MNVVLDTHILVSWVGGVKHLDRAQHRAIEKAASTSALWVSDISLWEVAMLVEGGRLKLTEPLDTWLERATAAPAVARVGLTPKIVHELASLPTTRTWDPADRIIVATARVLGATLVTNDARIIDSELVRTT